ncbi:50S ribosomal protein L6 [Candidatus Woesearchaeota archaeon]|nr:50S ribosomal protein L6 [Candidatus Woesearchaeota archaeon]
MKVENLTLKVPIPNGVQVSVETGIFTFKGPKGELVRDLQSTKLHYSVEGSEVVLVAPKATKKEKALIYTMVAHIKNCLKGVVEGFVYKLAICSGHFPMTVAYNNGEITVKNFIGEAVPRKAKLPENVDVKIDGKDITLTGIDVEKVGLCASRIEKLTGRTGFDKRRFQDGIYIVDKNGKLM